MEVQFAKMARFAFQKGEGKMGEYSQRYPWSDIFPDSGDRSIMAFKTCLNILLRAKFPMALFSGKDHNVYYNDSFLPYLPAGGEHGWAFGKPGAEVWPETWPLISFYIKRTLSGEDVTVKKDHFLFGNGHGENENLEYGFSPVCDEEGFPCAVFVTLKDNGRMNNALADKNVSKQDVNQVVKERTEELQALNEELIATNEELSEANANLTRANRDLEQFAYVASHDLQEPLRKIQIFSNILTDRFSSDVSEGASRYIQKIRASADRMSSLIKDLLDYARLVNNRPKFTHVDLNIVLKDVIVDYELLVNQKKILINTDHLPSVEAIPIQMNQLFYNLIGNSIKFIRKGIQPVINIRSRILDQEEIKKYPKLKSNRKYVEITVSDNGIGFSQQYADKIFTIFQQLNDKSTYGGYGIGLSLCQRIVENHYGVIFAAGTENEGASFTFIIPVRIEI